MGLSIIVMLFSRQNSALLQAVSSDTPQPAGLCLGSALSAEGDVWCRSSGWDSETKGPELTALGMTKGQGLVAWPSWGTLRDMAEANDPRSSPSLHFEEIKLRSSFVCGLSSETPAQAVVNLLLYQD